MASSHRRPLLPLLALALALAAAVGVQAFQLGVGHTRPSHSQLQQQLQQQQRHRGASSSCPPARRPPAPLPAAASSSSSSAGAGGTVTTWAEQEKQGFVAAPPGVAALVARVQGKAEGPPVLFEETLKAMDAHYEYTPRRFVNGDAESAEGTNAGSCKLLSLGVLHGLDPATLLKLFGEHYRSVLRTPKGQDHGNIRNMITKGWAGVSFPDGLGLALKK